jgi:predicted  nucleic acid-binding Zn-ribbon protein
VGNIDILALFKYLWAALVPILIKGWSMIDKRFEQTEHKVIEIDKRVSDMSADVKVLVERSENQQNDISEIKDLLMQLLLDKSKR